MSEPTRVLVVEDDPDALLLLRMILRRRPEYEIVFCSSPAQALALAQRRFEVLVTDLQMPGMSGLELAAAMRRWDPALPVLLVTAHASAEAAVRAGKGSVTEILAKPLHADAVRLAIDTAARSRRAPQPVDTADRGATS